MNTKQQQSNQQTAVPAPPVVAPMVTTMLPHMPPMPDMPQMAPPVTVVPKPGTEQKIIKKPIDPALPLPLVLLVLDGWGVASPSRGNSISLARTPHMNKLMEEYPTVTLHASGEVVGLPWAEVGNSEVGHLNIGAGKIIYQQLPMINKSISEGTFFKNNVFLEAMAEVKKRGSRLHIMGMVSNGGVHSSQDHLFALLELCRDQGLSDNVFVHAFLDGRDTEKNAALGFIAQLETKMHETGVGRIASLSGRYWAMDRDTRWERTQKAYNAIRFGKSEEMYDSPLKAIEVNYQQNIFDEEFPPTVIVDEKNEPIGTVNDNDVVLFFNFRSDRARQITRAFVLPAFQKFDRGPAVKNLIFVTMTEYEENLPVRVAFQPDHVNFPVGKVVSDAGWNQLRVAETEKYAHVTFFFNGGSEKEVPGEDRALIPSPRVPSYDKTPAMSVQEVADRVVQEIATEKYQFIVANFANVDMVGHTGNLQAAIQAVEAADTAIGKVAEAVQAIGGTLVITADHGNAEEMVNLQTGEIIKEHSTNPVPFIMCNELLKQQRMTWTEVIDGDLSHMQPVGVLSDAAPTILSLMGLDIPPDMTSRSLIR